MSFFSKIDKNISDHALLLSCFQFLEWTELLQITSCHPLWNKLITSSSSYSSLCWKPQIICFSGYQDFITSSINAPSFCSQVYNLMLRESIYYVEEEKKEVPNYIKVIPYVKILQQYKKLESLDITHESFYLSALLQSPFCTSFFKQLKKLTLKYKHKNYNKEENIKITQVICTSLSKACPNLTSLSLLDLYDLPSLKFLETWKSTLTELSLERNEIQKDWESLFNCTKLTSLNLCLMEKEISVAAVLPFYLLTNLTSLTLIDKATVLVPNFILPITSSSSSSFISQLKRLELIPLGLIKSDHNSFEELKMAYSYLQNIPFTTISSFTFRSSFMKNFVLTKEVISSFTNLTELEIDGFVAAQENHNLLECFSPLVKKNLRKLVLEGIQCIKLTCLKECTSLQELRIRGYKQIQKKELKTIGNLPALKYLDLYGFYWPKKYFCLLLPLQSHLELLNYVPYPRDDSKKRLLKEKEWLDKNLPFTFIKTCEWN